MLQPLMSDRELRIEYLRRLRHREAILHPKAGVRAIARHHWSITCIYMRVFLFLRLSYEAGDHRINQSLSTYSCFPFTRKTRPLPFDACLGRRWGSGSRISSSSRTPVWGDLYPPASCRQWYHLQVPRLHCLFLCSWTH